MNLKMKTMIPTMMAIAQLTANTDTHVEGLKVVDGVSDDWSVESEFGVPRTEYMITDTVNMITDHTSAANGILNSIAKVVGRTF
jgi:hypothetical protein